MKILSIKTKLIPENHWYQSWLQVSPLDFLMLQFIAHSYYPDNQNLQLEYPNEAVVFRTFPYAHGIGNAVIFYSDWDAVKIEYYSDDPE